MLVVAVKAPSNFYTAMQSDTVASRGWIALTVSVHATLSGGQSLTLHITHYISTRPPTVGAPSLLCFFLIGYDWRERVLTEYEGVAILLKLESLPS